MKTTIRILISLTLVTVIASNALAKDEKKRAPKVKEVEEILKGIGGDHYVEEMEIKKIGYSQVDATFYHSFNGIIDKGVYRVYIFDNTPRYLGYYPVTFEPSTTGPRKILLDSNEVDEETGNTRFIPIVIKEDGPSEKINVEGNTVAFVPTPIKVEEKKEEEGTTVVREYREWNLIVRGRKHTIRAIFVKRIGNKVYLKEELRGITKDFPYNNLSDADKEYVSQFSIF